MAGRSRGSSVHTEWAEPGVVHPSGDRGSSGGGGRGPGGHHPCQPFRWRWGAGGTRPAWQGGPGGHPGALGADRSHGRVALWGPGVVPGLVSDGIAAVGANQRRGSPKPQAPLRVARSDRAYVPRSRPRAYHERARPRVGSVDPPPPTQTLFTATSRPRGPNGQLGRSAATRGRSCTAGVPTVYVYGDARSDHATQRSVVAARRPVQNAKGHLRSGIGRALREP